MKIAIYQVHGSGQIIFQASEWIESRPDYLRLTEIVEVELPMLPPEVTVPAQIKQIDAAEAELRNKFNEKLSELMDRRKNLLALTHDASPETLR